MYTRVRHVLYINILFLIITELVCFTVGICIICKIGDLILYAVYFRSAIFQISCTEPEEKFVAREKKITKNDWTEKSPACCSGL